MAHQHQAPVELGDGRGQGLRIADSDPTDSDPSDGSDGFGSQVNCKGLQMPRPQECCEENKVKMEGNQHFVVGLTGHQGCIYIYYMYGTPPPPNPRPKRI